jgi:hypothetical protein
MIIRGVRNVLIAWLLLTGIASAENLWGLTTDHTLVRFSSSAPGTLLASFPITGLPEGERIVGIEVLDPEGTFVGVSTAGRFYALDRLTGAATILNPAAPAVPLSGTAFGMRDRGVNLEIVSNNGSALMGDKLTWWSQPGIALPPPAHVVAWTSNFHAWPQQALLDSSTDTLYGPGFDPQSLIGPLNVDTSDEAGLDAGPHDGKLYAALTVNGAPGLYTIDSTTGNATLVGAIPSAPITSLTIDLQGSPRLEPLTPEIVEGNTTLTVTVRRTGDTTVAAQYLVETTGGGTPVATAGQDFVAKSETLDFAAGEVEKTIAVTILDDATRETRELFRLTVRENVTNGLPTLAEITILDDENQPPVLTVTSPALPAYVSENVITLTGTVTDDTGGFTVMLCVFESPCQTATSSPWSFNAGLGPGLTPYRLLVTDAQGETARIFPEIWLARDGTSYFAEGATGTFFDTELAFANPHPIDIPVTIEFLREDGTVVPHAFTLGAERRSTLNVETVPGLEGTTTAAVVHTPYPIMAERTMRWGATAYGAHTEKASGLSQKWYFAEGSQGFFFTYLQLVNPHATDNPVTVRFLREGDAPVTKTFPLGPHARFTVDAGSMPELQDRAFGMEVQFTTTGLAERAMYFGLDPFWKAGHGSAGVSEPAGTWFLAEGATGAFFETFVLVANPSSEPANVTMTFLPENGSLVTRTKHVPAGGRLTVNIEQEDPSLANAAVATSVRATVPVVVERAQYWPWSPDQWYEAHGSFGSSSWSGHWGLAEGRVGGPEDYRTFILLANDNREAATVTIRFLRESGQPVIKEFTVAPQSRLTIDVGFQVPEITDGAFGADIRSTRPITAERAMYASPGGLLWSTGTSASAVRLIW